MRYLLSVCLLLLLAACAPREWLFPKLGLTPPSLQEFPPDYKRPISNETGQPMPGFGGESDGRARVPVIFIHGNTVSARYWLPARRWFAGKGYTLDQLWGLGYGWDNLRYFDSDDLSVDSIERIVDSVTGYLQDKTGHPVEQVDIVSHSLGVTLVRQWMKQYNAWHRVRSFVGACGANHGVWTAWPDSHDQNRIVSQELAPGSPWLVQLNRGGETPGPTRYMTLYDGSGHGDELFPQPYQDSPALDGAYNLAFDREQGKYYGHLELPREPDTLDAMIDFLRQAPEPAVRAAEPVPVRGDGLITASQPDSELHCAVGGDYPGEATPAAASFDMRAPGLYTCYARNRDTHYASPMVRFKQSAGRPAPQVLTVAADPAGGVYENALNITLSANDPDAFIVYTTSSAPLTSGSPLYQAPIVVDGPVKLRAMAIGPDGRRSQVVELSYDVSLEKIESEHSLQRQFDPDAPEQYAGLRKVGH
jgi:pimeloyl-ACP methyl ester carboxylesterase